MDKNMAKEDAIYKLIADQLVPDLEASAERMLEIWPQALQPLNDDGMPTEGAMEAFAAVRDLEGKLVLLRATREVLDSLQG